VARYWAASRLAASSTRRASTSFSHASTLSETDTPSGSFSPADYVYDAQSRVTGDTPGSGSAMSYVEDASGNLTTTPTGASGTYDNASELTSSTLSGATTSYTYDASGNRVGASVGGTATLTATYNGASQLTSYNNSSANMSTATYDGNGLRTAETTGSSTQHFVWNTTTSVPEFLMNSTSAYVYGPGGTPFEQVLLSSGTIRYLVGDALGSVRGVVSSAGSLLATTAYDAWGNPETSGGLSSYSSLGFAGGYADPTGLVYLINRYYDPTTGSFINVDPDVAETGQPYAYVGDDPVDGTDPLGLWSLNPLSDIAEVATNAATEVTSHWHGLAKIGIAAVVVVGGSACVLATAGICGAAAFGVGSVEISGGAVALGFAAGAAEGQLTMRLIVVNTHLEGI
jgi:RHS repeat-associated protein